MPKKIVILEDNEDRREAMRRCLQDRFYQFEHVFFDEATPFIQYLRDHLTESIVICLDHDLELKTNGDGTSHDPGTGREIVDYLAKLQPVCPVVIHSSNEAAALGMELALQEAKWTTFRIAPFGDLEWIPTQWFRCVRRAIVGPVRGEEARVGSSTS
jgi:hypothetical protein